MTLFSLSFSTLTGSNRWWKCSNPNFKCRKIEFFAYHRNIARNWVRTTDNIFIHGLAHQPRTINKLKIWQWTPFFMRIHWCLWDETHKHAITIDTLYWTKQKRDSFSLWRHILMMVIRSKPTIFLASITAINNLKMGIDDEIISLSSLTINGNTHFTVLPSGRTYYGWMGAASKHWNESMIFIHSNSTLRVIEGDR